MSKQFRILVALLALLMIGATVYWLYQAGFIGTKKTSSTSQTATTAPATTTTTSPTDQTATQGEDVGTATDQIVPTVGDSKDATALVTTLAPNLYTFSYDDPSEYQKRIDPYILVGRNDQIYARVGPPDLDSSGKSQHPNRRSIARLDTISTTSSSTTDATFNITLKVVEVEGQTLVSQQRITFSPYLIHTAQGWQLSAITF